MRMENIKLLIIDNYTLFWEGFRHMDESEKNFVIQDIQKFDANFERMVTSYAPDVLLIDADIIVENQDEIFASMKRLEKDVKLAVISERADNRLIEALDVGATGYLLRNMEYDDFIEALQTIQQGECWFHPFMTGPFMKRCQEMFTSNESNNASLLPMPPFTAREYDVLKLLVKGYSNKMIADDLDITSFTVNSHIRNILKKSNANDRTHAVVLAIEHNWLHLYEDKYMTLEDLRDEA